MKKLIKSRKFKQYLLIAILIFGTILTALEIYAQDGDSNKSQYYKVLDGIVKSNAFDEGTIMITVITCTIALFIGAAMAFLELGWSYIKNVFNAVKSQGASSIAQYGPAVRILVLLALIVVYIPMVKALTGTMDFINDFTTPSIAQNEQAETWSDAIMKKHKAESRAEIDTAQYKLIVQNPGNYTDSEVQWAQKELDAARQVTDEGDGDIGIIGAIRSLKNLVQNISSAIIVGLLTLLGQIVRVVVMIFAKYTMKIVIILGPLSIAFSIFSPFEDNLERWFKYFLTLGFVFMTLNIIDNINFIFLKQCFSVKNLVSPDESEATLNIVISIVNLMLYTMPFYLTSLFIGGKDGGKILTKTVQVATAAAIVAMTGGAGAAAGAGSSATNVGKAAQVGGRAMEEN